MKVIITHEDVKNAGNYGIPNKCPLALVMKKLLNNKSVIVGLSKVIDEEGLIGHIKPQFTYGDYERLKEDTNASPFEAIYTPIQ